MDPNPIECCVVQTLQAVVGLLILILTCVFSSRLVVLGWALGSLLHFTFYVRTGFFLFLFLFWLGLACDVCLCRCRCSSGV